MSPRTGEIQPGAVIGKGYEVVRCLGSGAMGVVYAARQLSMGREVAVKVMTQDALWSGGEQLERFYREAYNASRLNHPHIVRVQDFGVDGENGTPYIVMELLEGCTLAQYLEEVGPLDLDEACLVAIQVAKGLSAAHALDIIHRDLKPENVMIRPLPGGVHATILDFGISKRLVSDDAPQADSLTGRGALVGTPRYMSPEQVSGHQVSPKADLYALGCIFYEMLEGHPPFDADDSGNVLLKHLNAPPPRLTRLPSSTRAHRAESLFLDLLAKTPEARPVSANDVVRTLKELCSPLAHTEPLDDTLLRVADSPQWGRSGPPGQFRRWSLAGFFGLLGLLAGFGFYQLLHRPVPLVATTVERFGCPIWTTSGVEEPSGWLGAAAADVLCRRARWLMGGDAAETLGPATLLALPAWPEADSSLDPYANPSLVAQSEASAAENATSWATGHIHFERAKGVFFARMKLKASADRRRSTAFEGQGRAPFEAVWEAMDAAVEAGAFVAAPQLDPDIAQAWQLDSVRSGLELQEMILRRATGLGMEDLCSRLLGREHLSSSVQIHMDLCPERPGDVAGEPPPDAIGLAWWIARAMASGDGSMLGKEQAQASLKALQAELSASPPDTEQNFILSMAASLLLFKLDEPLAPARARQLIARRPAEQLILRDYLEENAVKRPLVEVTSQHVWHPHSLDVTRRVPRQFRLKHARRLYLLTGGKYSEHPDIAYRLGHALIEQQRLEESRTFASTLASGHPSQRKNAILLEAEVGLAEGDFLQVTRRLTEIPEVAEFVPLVRHLRVLAKLSPELRPRAFEIFRKICSRKHKLQMDSFERAMLQLELASHFPENLGSACLAAFDATRPKLAQPNFFQHCREGVARWLRADRTGALAAWRQIRPARWGCRAPVEAFDRVVASGMDAPFLDNKTYGGAHPAQLREARRAFERGDLANAKQLAKRVTEAWSKADVAIPAVAELQEALERTASRP